MEHAQRAGAKVTKDKITVVLILILMEHAQRGTCITTTLVVFTTCLNPYFNGTCSKRFIHHRRETHITAVLILILMEHAQRG